MGRILDGATIARAGDEVERPLWKTDIARHPCLLSLLVAPDSPQAGSARTSIAVRRRVPVSA